MYRVVLRSSPMLSTARWTHRPYSFAQHVVMQSQLPARFTYPQVAAPFTLHINRIFSSTPTGGAETLPRSDNDDEGSCPTEKAAKRSAAASQPPSALASYTQIFSQLSKARLSALVLMTTGWGWYMAGGGPILPMLGTMLGTGLSAASANTINQVIEVKPDALMKRTKGRPLPSGRISRPGALAFGVGCGVAGVGLLATTVNPLTAALSAATIGLYTMIYTPMKRMHHSNTYVGAVVGAIPPMMGWTAVANSLDPGAWLLGGILFAWQMPHFMALAWMCRQDYEAGGYVMQSKYGAESTAKVGELFALSLIPMCLAAPYMGLCTPWFALESTAINLGLWATSYKFRREQSNESARKMFYASLLHLPLLMVALALHRRHDDDDEAEEEMQATGADALQA